MARQPSSSEEIMKLEDTYGAHNYHPLPVVVSRAEGVFVWDLEGNRHYDFLAAYSAVNQGHRHPKIVQALVEQSQKMTICSRAFYSDTLGAFEKFLGELLGYEMVLPMNTGAEGVETAIKLARKWGYVKKGIPEDKAIVLGCTGNFHGRTFGAISMSTDPSSTSGYGPLVPLLGPLCLATDNPVRYNNVDDLRMALEAHGHHVAGFLVEPIQGEAGVIVPDDGYLKRCYDLCKQYNVLFIADEIQSGLGRSGTMLAVEHDNVRPDILVLGKALGGGVFPVSAVLADRDIMLCIKPGEHGSTFGGNPMACAVAKAALEVIRDENLPAKSAALGKRFRDAIINRNHPAILKVRGRGLMNAIEIDEAKTHGRNAWDLCLYLKKNGLLTKPTHDTIIRLTPPLCITEAQIDESIAIIFHSLDELVRN